MSEPVAPDTPDAPDAPAPPRTVASTEAPRVRKATAADVPALRAVLARAFDDDPVSCFIYPSRRRRPAGLRAFFTLLLRHELLPADEVYTTVDLAGAAMWAPPGHATLQGVRGLWRVLPLVPHVAGHTLATLGLLSRIQSRHPTDKHWYLSTLGTEPDRQGTGIGSALIQPVLRRCDAEGIPAYLESSKERNLSFYRRHGFEATGEIAGHGAPTVWTMWREPRPPG